MFAKRNVMIADNIEKINFKFNEELSQQINGILPKGHIYELGHPCDILLSTGFPDLPIDLSSTRLEEKSIRNLVLALNDPIAVFLYGDERKAQNVIVELKNDNKNFVVGIFFNQSVKGNIISSVRGIFNKNNSEWLNWAQVQKYVFR